MSIFVNGAYLTLRPVLRTKHLPQSVQIVRDWKLDSHERTDHAAAWFSPAGIDGPGGIALQISAASSNQVTIILDLESAKAFRDILSREIALMASE